MSEEAPYFIKVPMSDARRIVLSCYIGNKCDICSREYSTVEILDEVNPIVIANEEKGLKFVCKKCYKKGCL